MTFGVTLTKEKSSSKENSYQYLLKNSSMKRTVSTALIFLIIGIWITLSACNQTTTSTTATADTSIASSAVSTGATEKLMPGGPVANTIMTDEYVRTLATYVYVWGWPLVNVHNRLELFKTLPGPLYSGGVVPVAPPNQLCMLTDYVVEERAVACPNQDVVYCIGGLDLDKDAVVIQVPDFGDRFWVYQVCDQRTDRFANLGKMYGTKPGFYLLAGKDWNGKVPDGINTIFMCPTRYGIVIPRVFQTDDPADKKQSNHTSARLTCIV
jgi:hypothetical protein